jgi:hypothetical protein
MLPAKVPAGAAVVQRARQRDRHPRTSFPSRVRLGSLPALSTAQQLWGYVVSGFVAVDRGLGPLGSVLVLRCWLGALSVGWGQSEPLAVAIDDEANSGRAIGREGEVLSAKMSAGATICERLRFVGHRVAR